MNNSLKIFGAISLLCFSFYYTNQFALLMQQKDPIYQTILTKKEENVFQSVDALVEGDYITPGLNGKMVNVEKSFRKMKNMGSYLENYLVYDEIPPTITQNDYKDKIIKKGNPNKNSVAIIFEENNELVEYFEEMGMDYTILVNKENYGLNFLGEKINNDYSNYADVEKLLSKNNENHNLCLVDQSNLEFCQKNKKILVTPSLKINNSNFARLSSSITAGEIIYIKNLRLDYLKLLIQNIVYHGYTIIPLSALITESR